MCGREDARTQHSLRFPFFNLFFILSVKVAQVTATSLLSIATLHFEKFFELQTCSYYETEGVSNSVPAFGSESVGGGRSSALPVTWTAVSQ
jgi:hypothetical protein